jgi:hypothetical protein
MRENALLHVAIEDRQRQDKSEEKRDKIKRGLQSLVKVIGKSDASDNALDRSVIEIEK